MSLAVLLKKELRRIVRQELRPVATRLLRAERRVAQLRRLVRRRQPRAIAANPRPAPGPRRPGRKLKLSRARRAALRLHGQYLGYSRLLPPRQKAAVKATRAVKGVEAAIRMAKRLAKA